MREMNYGRNDTQISGSGTVLKMRECQSYIVFEHGKHYNILGQLILQGIENEKQFIRKNKKQAIKSETMIQTYENPESQTGGKV